MIHFSCCSSSKHGGSCAHHAAQGSTSTATLPHSLPPHQTLLATRFTAASGSLRATKERISTRKRVASQREHRRKMGTTRRAKSGNHFGREEDPFQSPQVTTIYLRSDALRCRQQGKPKKEEDRFVLDCASDWSCATHIPAPAFGFGERCHLVPPNPNQSGLSTIGLWDAPWKLGQSPKLTWKLLFLTGKNKDFTLAKAPASSPLAHRL